MLQMIPHSIVECLYLFLAVFIAGAGWTLGSWLISKIVNR